MTGEIMRKGVPAPVPVLIILLVSTLVFSCGFGGFGKSLPTRNYYVLNYSPPAANGTARHTQPFSLQVERFNVQRVYNRQNIVYRFAPQELKWYEYQQWAVRPDYMVTDLVLNHLGSAGVFNRVGTEFLDSRPDFRLEGTVEAVEKFDAGDVFFAHLAMSFRMVRVVDGQQVWEYSFDERSRVYQKEMVYTVIALSGILQNQMTAVVGQLDSVLAALGGVPAQKQPAVAPAPAPAASDTARAAVPEPGYTIIPESTIRRR